MQQQLNQENTHRLLHLVLHQEQWFWARRGQTGGGKTSYCAARSIGGGMLVQGGVLFVVVSNSCDCLDDWWLMTDDDDEWCSEIDRRWNAVTGVLFVVNSNGLMTMTNERADVCVWSDDWILWILWIFCKARKKKKKKKKILPSLSRLRPPLRFRCAPYFVQHTQNLARTTCTSMEASSAARVSVRLRV